MSRLRWPVAPYSALAAGALTLAVAPWASLAPVDAPTPTQPVTATLEGPALPGLTEGTLNAALADVRTTDPLEVNVYTGAFPADASARSDALRISFGLPAGDEYWSVRVNAPSGSSTAASSDAYSAFSAASSVGGQSTAVAAAVRAWEGAQHQPTTPGAARIALTAIGATATTGLLAWFLLRRRTWKERQASVVSARRTVASVMVQLDAAEVEARTTPGQGQLRTTALFRELEALTLDLARREESVLAAVSRPWRAASPSGRAQRALFVDDARLADDLAEQLGLASSFLGERTGAITAWDRVIAPTVLAAQSLLREAQQAPPAVALAVSPDDLEAAVDQLLALGRRVSPGDSATEGSTGPAQVREVRRLEDTIGACADQLRTALEGRGRLASAEPVPLPEAEDPLRADLGLPALPPATVVDRARATLAGYLGTSVPRPTTGLLDPDSGAGFDTDPRAGRGTERGWAWTRSPGRAGAVAGSRPQASSIMRSRVAPAALQAVGAAAGMGLVLWAAWGVAGILVPSGYDAGDTTGRTGSGDYGVRSLTVEGTDTGISQQQLDNTASVLAAPVPLDITVVGLRSRFSSADRIEEQGGVVSPQYRLTGEERRALLREQIAAHPELVDAATGDLALGKTLILVDTVEGRAGGVPFATGVGLGGLPETSSQLAVVQDLRTTYILNFYAPQTLSARVASEVADTATTVSNVVNGVEPSLSDGSGRWRAWALILAGLAAGATAVAGLVVGGASLLSGRGLLGRSLWRAASGLRGLNLGVDLARLDSVAVLGAGQRAASAAEEQRLYESWAVQALREHEELSALRGADRRSALALRRAALLEDLVGALVQRDAAQAHAATSLLRQAEAGEAA